MDRDALSADGTEMPSYCIFIVIYNGPGSEIPHSEESWLRALAPGAIVGGAVFSFSIANPAAAL